MKTLFAAVTLVMATSSLAYADDKSGALSYGSSFTCPVMIADSKLRKDKLEDIIFLEGLWSGLNATDNSDAHGWIGEGLKGGDMYLKILAECKKNPKNTAQDATYVVWHRLRDQALAALDGPSS